MSRIISSQSQVKMVSELPCKALSKFSPSFVVSEYEQEERVVLGQLKPQDAVKNLLKITNATTLKNYLKLSIQNNEHENKFAYTKKASGCFIEENKSEGPALKPEELRRENNLYIKAEKSMLEALEEMRKKRRAPVPKTYPRRIPPAV